MGETEPVQLMNSDESS